MSNGAIKLVFVLSKEKNVNSESVQLYFSV